MRVIIVSALCLFAAAPAAHAGSGSAQGLGVIGFIAGEAGGNQGSTFNQNTTVNGSGSSTGSSGSGAIFSMYGNNGSGVKYSSTGAAFSTVTVTPFGVSSASGHDTTAFGKAWGPDAGFSAANQTYGQSSGASQFTSVQKTKVTGYENSQYQVLGAIAFAGFEGSYTKN